MQNRTMLNGIHPAEEVRQSTDHVFRTCRQISAGMSRSSRWSMVLRNLHFCAFFRNAGTCVAEKPGYVGLILAVDTAVYISTC